MNKAKLTPASSVILAGGVIMLIGSFLPFYEFSILGVSRSWNAWSSFTNLFLFPLTTLIVVFGVVMAVQVALATFAPGTSLPDRPLGFTWDQVHLVLAFQVAIMMLAYLIRDKGRLDWGAGFWLMLLAAIALLAGAILRTRDTAGAPPFS